MLEPLCYTRNFDQNVCQVRGAYYANKDATYMEKFSVGEIPHLEKILKVLRKTDEGLRILPKSSARGTSL